MLRNYILVAIRNLTRQKFFSIINIAGLAVAMSICMGIMMLVADQMLYDRHNTKNDRIFRINTYAVDDKGIAKGGMVNATSPMPLKRELLDTYTGIERVARIKRGFGNSWLEFENQNVNIPVSGFFADPEVFDLFEYELQYGDPATALNNPFTVILSRKAANKLFKEENPTGLILKVGDHDYTVTGVLKETENKSHIVFEALASMASLKSLQAQNSFAGDDHDDENWMDFWNCWTYVLVDPAKPVSEIEASLEKIYTQHIASVKDPDAYKMNFKMQSLMDITPGPLLNNAIGPSLPWPFVYFLGGLAGVILLTSCFNFTNLSIARSLKRAREIGVRKVTGAARWQSFTQFLSESVVTSLFALVFAFLLLVIVKPLMLQMTFARVFMWDLEANYVVFSLFVVFAIAVGILAGMFPAAVLSGFQPVKVLKSINNVKIFSRLGLRKALLVSQFTLSLFFILSVIVMYNQLELFLNTDYGFNMKDNMMVRMNGSSAQALKTELLKYGNVKNVAAASHVPAAGMSNGTGFKKQFADKDWTGINHFSVDEDYLKNMEIELVAGKFFTVENGEGNKNFIVINEETARTLQYKTTLDAVGEELIRQYDSAKLVIIGVVKDYNHVQLMQDIEPMLLFYDPNQFNILQVRYSGKKEEAVKTVEQAWSSINPNLKMDFKTVEDEIKMFYNTVFGDVVNVMGVIAFLAIMISCLGLLGMATYSIETRMKEISVRKVLGSTDKALVLLLSKGFLKLLLISIVIGIPLAWFANNFWLEFMAYHTELGIGSILIGVLTMLLLAGITIGSQTLRAAFTNPVDNLKNE